ncbi:helix-turn-helix domain-containing protein [Nitrobacter sp. JJSN]|uniref:helix-turn-helix domain-containing protein n=1 Tax=Nitrobacter sp. JJSN TaxID=3453033 RepID=UPI003F77241B
MTVDDRRRTADKFRWLDQVGADHGLTPLCFRLAYAIVTFVNRATGDAWPSQPRLAADCNATDRAIRDAITRLRDRGHLQVTGKGGRGKTSHFKPLMIDLEKRNDASALLPAKVEEHFRDTEPKPGKERHETRKKTTAKPGSLLPTIPKRETMEEPIEKKSLAMVDHSFNEFWTVYPKKVDKLKAEKLYATIIKTKRATALQLLDGARRYAAAKAGTERKFIKHPSTWLNAGGWLDEPEHTARPAKTTQADTAISGFNRFLNREQ